MSQRDIVNRFGQGDPRHGATPTIPPQLEAAARNYLHKHNATDITEMLFTPPRNTTKRQRSERAHTK